MYEEYTVVFVFFTGFRFLRERWRENIGGGRYVPGAFL
jgi:hypothetical protein